MRSHPLTNFEIQKYYQDKLKLNGVYSTNNFPKIKNEAYLINLDEYKSIESHWIALYLNENNIVYFERFRVEHIPDKIKKFIGKNKYL